MSAAQTPSSSPSAEPAGWTLLIDRGGTFTDVVAADPSGRLHVRKLLSGDETARRVLAALSDSLPLDARAIRDQRIGTTVATNALLERTGPDVLLVTTAGLGDLPLIGDQQRPDLFALRIDPRRPLHVETYELDERVRVDGTVERAPDRQALAAALRGHRVVAVALANAWAHPEHERMVEQVAREVGVERVTLSHRVAPEPGLLARLETTVADAYLSPVLADFLARAQVPGARVLVMQSSGGLATPAATSGKDALLSGPAGGAVAVRHVGARAGFTRLLGFDMGGTSTDVCRCVDGRLEVAQAFRADGVRVRTPTLDVVTVAAGGGSVLHHADGRFQVGPHSAGADPGPACYGRGGPATITDANVVLGRIRPDAFPHMPLDVEAARARLAEFGEPEQAARGFLDIAIETMAEAVRRITVARGEDARDHALVSFGGAGGQHACELARRLGIRDVLVHPLAGVLSAWGLGLADIERHAVRPVTDAHGRPLRDPPDRWQPDFPADEVVAAVREQGAEDVDVWRRLDVRYAGADTALTLDWCDDWRARFAERHRQQYGFDRAGHALEVVAARCVGVGRVRRVDDAPRAEREHDATTELVDEHGARVYRRDALQPGARLAGPALVVEDNATTWLPAGWRARVDGHGTLRLRDEAAVEQAADDDSADHEPSVDPVTLQVMGHRFMAIAEQMGEHLRRVAHSTNIKERLDFSCALFDARGQLVANAPHVPVHLGAMGETVAALLAHRELRDGDAWVSNDPYHGGSHLPDLTVITPVFRDGVLAFLVANRGHHADIGGCEPGSMPPDSTHIEQEGALLRDVLLVRDGVWQPDEVAGLLRAAGTRDVDTCLADLAAQVASNTVGTRRLHELCERHGGAHVQRWMGHVLDNGEAVLRDVVARMEPGSFEDRLDDGSVIRCALSVADGRARIDFSGTSPQQPGNRNAPRAVTLAAVLYVFRTLAARPIPLNAGCLRPLDIVIPPGSLLDPRPPAAVVGGNVETSQRIVDVLYGALGVLAAGQGTMNNLTFGDDTFGYYETVCGGAGAGLGFDGASGVHVHMTNTRITDPEVLEQRYPVVVERFGLRRGSGGDGLWRGGDGVERRLRFLRPLRARVLAERRASAPWGVRAGPGACGADELSEHGVRLLTPGGGGYSPSEAQWAAMPPAMARRVFREGRSQRPTDGVSTGHARGRVLIHAAEHAETVAAWLREHDVRVLHRGLPGDARMAGVDGVQLHTDAPRYVTVTGHGRSDAPTPTAPFGAHHMAWLVDGLAHTALPCDAVTSAPGHDLILDAELASAATP